jgi:serine/threonine-protein kinase
MTSSTRLLDLLLRYEELQQQGHDVTPEELCRDCPELLDAVREQLHGLAQFDAFLQTTAGTTVPPQPGDALPPGGPVPGGLRYSLLALHAKGGLGEVYLARDAELNREVALKQMQPHLADQPDLRRRFLLEAEVTGRLEHPGIVPVYGLGVDARGRPFYAMRFIRGESLQQAIDGFHKGDGKGRDPGEHALAVRNLLGRFIAVCNAVAYAHSRGIIHRDLKPANVMLGAYGETLVVDWGLARPVARTEEDRAGGEQTLEPGSKPEATRGTVGTPVCMAPEQAAGRQSLIGPATDVYALGAMLYHLLTGSPPFEPGRLDELLERVQRGEFPPPRQRNLNVPRSLEAVCLKAMALKREDRYASATDLARDVEAFLADEPVSARPEPPSERLRRWLKRHRTSVMATLAAAAVALVALAVSTVLLQAAYRAEHSARGDAETSEKNARQQRDRAEEAFTLAEQTNGIMLDLAEDIRPAPGTQSITLKGILEKASVQYNRLRRVTGDRPEVLEGKARVRTALSELEINLGDTRAALANAQEGETLYRALLRREPDNRTWRAGLATARQRAGLALALQGRLPDSRAAHVEARDLRRKLVEEQPAEPRWRVELGTSHNHLGNLHNVRGDPAAAEVEYRRGLDLRQTATRAAPAKLSWQVALAGSLEKVADARYYQNDLKEAERYYRQALTVLDRVLEKDGVSTEWRRQRTEVVLALASTVQYLGRTNEARQLFAQGLARAQLYAGIDPQHTEWQRVVLQARAHQANLVSGNDEKALIGEMLAVFSELLALTEKRVALDPYNLAWQLQRAAARLQVASSLIGLVRLKVKPPPALDEAEKMLEQTRQELEPVGTRMPDSSQCMLSQARVHLTLSALHEARGERGKLWEAQRRGMQTIADYYQRQHDAEPTNDAWLEGLARATANVANALNLIGGRGKESVTTSRRAVALARRMVSKRPDSVAALAELVRVIGINRNALVMLAIAEAQSRHPNDAGAAALAADRSAEYAEREARLFETMVVYRRLLLLEPRNSVWHYRLAAGQRELANQRRRTGDDAGATAALAGYLHVLDRLYLLVPEEAKRNPFATQQVTGRTELLVNVLHTGDPNKGRSELHLCEIQYRLRPSLERAVEVVDRLVTLVVGLNEQKPIPVAEVRLALRRGVALLRRLEEARTLPRSLAVQLPFFEKHLAGLPADPDQDLPADLRPAFDRMAYRELAGRLLERKQGRELVLLLDREARRVSRMDWAREGLTRLVLEDLAGTRATVEAILKTAHDLDHEKPSPLSPAGKKLLATLALYGGDAEAARQLDAGVAKAGQERTVLVPLAHHLRQRGQLAAAIRLLAGWVEGQKEAAAWEDHFSLAELYQLAGQRDRARQSWQNALKALPKKAGDDPRRRHILQQLEALDSH